MEAIALYHVQHSELAFIGSSEMRSLNPTDRRRIEAMRVEQQRMVDREVVAAAAAGQFLTRRPREAARAVVTMCTALASWYHPDGPYHPDR